LVFIVRIYHDAQSSECQIDPQLLGWERYTDMTLSGFLVTQHQAKTISLEKISYTYGQKIQF